MWLFPINKVQYLRTAFPSYQPQEKLMETQRLGSTRVMRPVSAGIISLEYTDRWSAFDRGASDQEIPAIGAARCACAVKSFQLAHAAGLPTHFIEQVGPRTIHVEEYSVPGRESLSGMTHGRILDLEGIRRDLVYGSLLERVKRGEVDPVSLGYKPGTKIREGMKLPRTLIEFTTKFEPVDRHLTDEEAIARAQITPSQYLDLRELITLAVRVTNARYEAVGFKSPDGKLELALRILPKGKTQIVLVDVFGTPDENRLINTGTGGDYSKDLLRNYLKSLPWKAQLDVAKKAYPTDKSKWPPYPKLPPEVVALVTERYVNVATSYSGCRIV